MASYNPSDWPEGDCSMPDGTRVAHICLIKWHDESAKKIYDDTPINKAAMEKSHDFLLECLKDGRAEMICIKNE